ncbi:hypothetical protein UC35_15650 [Ramlibacter tataouinensis]|uniref:Uncharacterized protein n=1 Tax=Ramlibacter tataouinensis TaxID=94132 RepID=A0A127JZV2_9BURK|nr:hypothetical protein UC35_15650 [Ramlibacter tataouinensis]
MLLVACVALSLLAGIAGGLLRVGIVLPGGADAAWLPRAALAHAALMTCGFLGTVIGIERATAAKHRLAWIAPLASGLAGVCLLAGAGLPARVLLVLAALAFTGVNIALLLRQWAGHTALLVASALAWLAGNVLFALDTGGAAVPAWWFAFLIMTIAAERLEMTRLMRRRSAAQPLLQGVLAALVLGAGLSALSPAAGGVLFGAALVALAVWLFSFDIARRTVHANGLSRYMAVCLLSGYVWLAVGGLAWAAMALGAPARDAALHALGLGFIVSMIMGHAPVILPAVAGVKLRFGGFFYLPLAALHASLLLRLVPGGLPGWRAQGAVFNAAAIALFALTVAGAAMAWRRVHGAGQSKVKV